ncbi:LacI family DNA-binding transcriptional regulator [uncultured Tenacibaculum sp.]|uniref:LacI family DNA-binding transcriptional regulator n=1 Tax=uncultured Tenacibaculum sp. TaxID=174713 RepID=UPI00263655DB|nr:LacI family DNA-binding transcriptional regulator [uncultured Tenacibaculum sp.]
MSNQVTLKDIAKILNVSASTVSKALNDSHEISQQTKDNVISVAKSLNYIPNDIARSLKSNATKRIGVILPNIESDFFAKVIRAIEDEATKRNYKILIILSNDTIEKEIEGVSILLNGSVDGVIISLAQETEDLQEFSHLQNFKQRKLPVVMFDRVCYEIGCDKITIDDFEATYETTKYLHQQGCKNIAFLSTIYQTSVGKLRKEGYVKANEDLKIEENLVIEIPKYKKFNSILKSHLKKHSIDAIITSDQLSAICTLKVIQENGFRIPKDISVVGFTDGLVPQYTIPSLSIIDQNEEKIGKLALNTLINRIENTSDKSVDFSHEILKTNLIKRQSSL